MTVMHKIQLGMEVGDAVPLLKRLPVDAVIRHVNVQHNVVTLWYETNNAEKRTKEMTFYVVGTGRDIPPKTRYLGTCIMHDGQIVAHVYVLEASVR